jgi:hypothetical protein
MTASTARGSKQAYAAGALRLPMTQLATVWQLIAESTPAGVRKREILYLGDIPVGVVQ